MPVDGLINCSLLTHSGSAASAAAAALAPLRLAAYGLNMNGLAFAAASERLAAAAAPAAEFAAPISAADKWIGCRHGEPEKRGNCR